MTPTTVQLQTITTQAEPISPIEPKSEATAHYTIPGLILLCFIIAFIVSSFPSVPKLTQRIIFKRSSKIPCQNCRFFSNSSYLKCAVHPMSAMTQNAIDCSDYQSPQKSHSSVR
ncbi:hypothetical protein ACN4EK_03375 [Pantanalinema rosaneae CENA516]|uniref:hypothetical protein n=1 Tax=Pantanalinema rosaneae TaxID=1620701 RepID=UPI003D6EF87B